MPDQRVSDQKSSNRNSHHYLNARIKTRFKLESALEGTTVVDAK